MLVTKKNYDSILLKLISEEKKLSEQVVELFADCKKTHMNVSSVGNSIASGYTKCDEMLPFLVRSGLYEADWDIDFYCYARVRRNEELNILKWYHHNMSHQDINKLLMADIEAKKDKYAGYGDVQHSIYEKMAQSSMLGFKDYVKLDNNIMIYNGLSGSFTDIVRKGEAYDRKKILQCFKNDFEYLKMFLMEVYLDNPEIQVYVCGLPDILGAGVTSLYDTYMKKAVKIVPNAVYVKGVSRNVLSMLNNQKEPDYHYSTPEYLYLLCGVWKSVYKNFVPLSYKCKILRKLAEYSDMVEFADTTSKGESEVVKRIIIKCTEEYVDLFEKYQIDVTQIKKEIRNYYNNHYLVHYGCTNRGAVKEVLQNLGLSN